MAFGAKDEDAVTYYTGGNFWMDGTELKDYHDPRFPLPPAETTVGISPPPELNLEPGVKSDGDDLEADLLRKIADNTAVTASNQGQLAQALGAVVDAVNKNTEAVANKPVGGGGSAAPATDMSGVEQRLDTISGKLDTTEGAAQVSQLQGQGHGLEGLPGAVTDAEIDALGVDREVGYNSQKLAWLRDWITSNPYSMALAQSGMQLSGATCTMSFDLMGATMSFSLCPLQPGFETAGNVLLAISVLYGLFMVVRR